MRALVLTAQLSYIYNGLLALIYKKSDCVLQIFFFWYHISFPIYWNSERWNDVENMHCLL
jgi:hypothetical protein